MFLNNFLDTFLKIFSNKDKNIMTELLSIFNGVHFLSAFHKSILDTTSSQNVDGLNTRYSLLKTIVVTRVPYSKII